MFICGNDEAAKKTVSVVLDQFGWESVDMGKVQSSPCHRAAVHAVVHPWLPSQRMERRVQAVPQLRFVRCSARVIGVNPNRKGNIFIGHGAATRREEFP